MVPIIPKQRQTPVTASKRFNTLINYLQGDREKRVNVAQEGPSSNEPGTGLKVPVTSDFSELLDYATNPVDTKIAGEKCIAIRTHGVSSIETASLEMNAVSRKNRRCEDPVYHFILSWPEHERPDNDAIFDAAEHAIKSLGFEQHQYVVAVHANTDNLHCHIALNRVHPTTFKSRHIEWAKRTLHYAARESEIKHGWSHDNGIYVVEVDGNGEKSIVLNAKFSKDPEQGALTHPEIDREDVRPAWHDPDSLDSWLKSKVAKALRKDLDSLQSWQALHVWLDQYGIEMKDTGGGGMRLRAVSPETGEVLDLPASKGLRQLKRADLEKRWGPFKPVFLSEVIAPSQSHLTPNQLQEGVEYVLGIDAAYGISPPHHLLGIAARTKGDARSVSKAGSGLHDLPGGSLAGDGRIGDLLLPGSVQERVGNSESGKDSGLRHHASSAGQGGAGGRIEDPFNTSVRMPRDAAERKRRVVERAAQRADLRRRYSTYKNLVSANDIEYFARLKALKLQRSQAIKAANTLALKGRAGVVANQSPEARLEKLAEIGAEAALRKLAANAEFSRAAEELRATRVVPLTWRHWLLEQANRSDKAALAALRGIVYQERRDAKAKEREELEDADPHAPGYKEQQHKRLLKQLLEEERREAAIRSSSVHSQRAHEAEALVLLYAGLVWRVTGNGNVEYSTADGAHVFTDRGSRVTFDRVHVTDDEIQAALLHSREKFGNEVLLTGDDPVFSARMARIAAGLGIAVVNPELQQIVRESKGGFIDPGTPIAANEQGRGGEISDRPLQPVEMHDAMDRLRNQVRDIDPGARFVEVDRHDGDRTYVGPVVVRSQEEPSLCAQHLGRSMYALHNLPASPDEHDQRTIIRYTAGAAGKSSEGVSTVRGR